MIGAVPLDAVLDHLGAPLVREVHVDVGHLDALGVQEPLERQAVLDRVDVGDAEQVEDDAAGRRAARPAGDLLLARPGDEVPDQQDVRREAGLADDFQLVFEALTDVLGRVRVPLRQALAAATGQALVGTLAGPHDVVERREVDAPEVERQVAALGDGQRVGDRLRRAP